MDVSAEKFEAALLAIRTDISIARGLTGYKQGKAYRNFSIIHARGGLHNLYVLGLIDEKLHHRIQCEIDRLESTKQIAAPFEPMV